MPVTEKILHILNGDCAAPAMKTAGLPGSFLVWREIYTEGPMPENLSDSDWRDLRAKFLSSKGVSYEKVRAELDFMYETLDQAASDPEYEIVLWLDICPFDKALKKQLLERLSKKAVCKVSISEEDIVHANLGKEEILRLWQTRKNLNG